MKNQKLISRNAIKKFKNGLMFDASKFAEDRDYDALLVREGKMSPQEYKNKYYPNSEVVNIPGYGLIILGKGMSGADPLLSLLVGTGRKAGIFSLNKILDFMKYSAAKKGMMVGAPLGIIAGSETRKTQDYLKYKNLYTVSSTDTSATDNTSTNTSATDNTSTNSTSTSSLTSQTNTERPSTDNSLYNKYMDPTTKKLRKPFEQHTDEELMDLIKLGLVPSKLTLNYIKSRNKQRQQRQLSSSSNNTPEQKEDIAITLNEMISEILAYIANGNKIEGINDVNDINKLEPWQILDVFRLIQRVYADEGTTPKEYESGYEPKKEEKEEKKQLQTSTSPFTGTTPSSVDLNRADVRAIMSHYGLDTTPSLRKAFRKYLGGDRNQDISFIDLNSNLHRDWVAPFVVFLKKGGNLVSRNIINRFKKTRKFYPGGTVEVNDNVPIDFNQLGDKAFSQSNQSTTTPRQQTNRRLTTSRQLTTNRRLTTNRLLTSRQLTTSRQQTNGLLTNRLQTNRQQAVQNTSAKRLITNKLSRNTVYVPSFYGTRASGRVNNDLLNLIPDNIKTVLIMTGFDPEAFNDVYDFLQGLNDYFAKDGDIHNQILVDGKWGNQTQKAYLMAILKALSESPILELDIIDRTEVPELLQILSPINVHQPVQRTYNRQQIRDLIRSATGSNPYNYTGDQRRALRLYLNGQSSDTSLLLGTPLENLLNY